MTISKLRKLLCINAGSNTSLRFKNYRFNAKMKNKSDSKEDNVVLQIQCSRQQLNRLIFRKPNPAMNNSIFNGEDNNPTQIKVNQLPLEAILNWWDVKISIVRNSTFFYDRKTIHQLDHVLVNKNLMQRFNPLKILPQNIQVSRLSKTEKCIINTSEYIAFIEKLIVEYPSLTPLLKFVQKDIKLLPDQIITRSSYIRYTNKYPYIRYLYKDVESTDLSSRKYDLQMEETISPKYTMFLGSPQLQNPTIEVECITCTLKFNGPKLIEELKAHFEERHAEEPDWKCTNCAKIFAMHTLAQTWWTHKC